MLDLGARRPGNDGSLEQFQRWSFARSGNLDSAVGAIPYPTREPQLASLSGDKPPKSDALHASANFDVDGFHP